VSQFQNFDQEIHSVQAAGFLNFKELSGRLMEEQPRAYDSLCDLSLCVAVCYIRMAQFE